MPRPTDYKPEYDQMLIDHMAKGYSFESFAGVCFKSKQTLYDWTKANASFLDALHIGKELCRLYWEKKSIDHMDGKVDLSEEAIEAVRATGIYPPPPGLNANHWKFNMINRFRDEWVDRTSSEITGSNGGPLQVETTPAQLKDMLKDAEGIEALETIIKKLGNK